eukprot:1890478-Rhodomonas_salina.1
MLVVTAPSNGTAVVKSAEGRSRGTQIGSRFDSFRVSRGVTTAAGLPPPSRPSRCSCCGLLVSILLSEASIRSTLLHRLSARNPTTSTLNTRSSAFACVQCVCPHAVISVCRAATERDVEMLPDVHVKETHTKAVQQV